MPRRHSERRPTSACRSNWRKPVTETLTVGRAPVDLGMAFGLVPGIWHRLRIQNTDANARLFVKTTTTAPSAGDPAHVVEPGKWSPPFGFFADTAAGPFGTWAWSDSDDCKIAASQDVTV